ncbi:MAG: hypothetical protein ACE5NM_06545 [Sedimentisphaerales bacterium]
MKKTNVFAVALKQTIFLLLCLWGLAGAEVLTLPLNQRPAWLPPLQSAAGREVPRKTVRCSADIFILHLTGRPSSILHRPSGPEGRGTRDEGRGAWRNETAGVPAALSRWLRVIRTSDY